MADSNAGAPEAPAAAPAEETLAKRLFGGSSVIHREAERRPFMVQFLKAQLPQDAYVEWLKRQSFVYAALEETDRALKDDPVVGRMHSPELYRTDAIDSDLRYFVGPDWRSTATCTPATQAYVDRIAWARDGFPPAYVAHQWLRYMGNMLGQEILRKILERAYGLTEEGTNFYRYPEVGDPRTFLGGYHARLNSMPLGDEEAQRFVDEGTEAFRLNIALTDELGRDFGIGEFSAEETEAIIEELAAEHP
ncbi:MAG TPA: biliverdin-producing heme oxygenase [Actinomycetota bacterium]|nr:biliverdin-producing heme oxygenase [Actinomycetota bacterium]